jgi:hypothetical protein
MDLSSKSIWTGAGTRSAGGRPKGGRIGGRFPNQRQTGRADRRQTGQAEATGRWELTGATEADGDDGRPQRDEANRDDGS